MQNNKRLSWHCQKSQQFPYFFISIHICVCTVTLHVCIPVTVIGLERERDLLVFDVDMEERLDFSATSKNR